MLGSGDALVRGPVAAAGRRGIRDRVAARIGFDERLAHLIEAGRDMFLMPSWFEPCGLNQMYSLRYGTVPIVRATGGLNDTVRGRRRGAGERPPGSSSATTRPTRWSGRVGRALAAFRNRSSWKAMQANGMRQDFSWDVSAREYVKVYRGA